MLPEATELMYLWYSDWKKVSKNALSAGVRSPVLRAGWAVAPFPAGTPRKMTAWTAFFLASSTGMFALRQ